MRLSFRLTFALLIAVVATTAFATSAFAAAPPNDNFANATAFVDGSRAGKDVSFTDATREPGEPTVAGSDTDHTVWFKWKATANGLMRPSTCAENSDATDGASLAVYSGGAVSSLTNLVGDHENCPIGSNAITGAVAVSAGQTYFIQVGAASSVTSGGLLLSVDFNTAVPANDYFADAQTLDPGLPQTLSYDNGLATEQIGEPDSDGDSWTNSVWFKWTPTTSQDVAIDTCGSNHLLWEPDSRLAIYTAPGVPAVNALTQLTSNDDGCGGNSYLSYVSFAAVSGTTYWIRQVNYWTRYGSPYKLHLHAVGALTNITPPVVENQGAPKITGKFEANTGKWDSSQGINYTYQWIRCDRRGANCADVAGQTTDEIALAADDLGHTFRVRVTADDSVTQQTITSAASLPVDDIPTNDLIANATDLGSAATVSLDDDNYLSDMETDEQRAIPTASSSVWYRWTAPTSAVYAIDVCADTGLEDSFGDFTVAAFTGDGTIPGSTLVAGSETGCATPGHARITINATAGTTYRIQVATALNNYGPFHLAIGLANPLSPPADPFPAFKLVKFGTIKPSKSGKINLKKLKLTCGPTATGPCTGSLTIKTAKTKVKGKTIKSTSQKFKLSVKPGKSVGTSYKLNSKVLGALKKAKKLKATVTVELGAPGFSKKSGKTSLTLKK
jgi:hypothetical protein